MAVHEGRGRDGQGDNPHAHLMISERQNDGLEHDEEGWFKRANSEEPELGVAPKSREFHGSQQIHELRERWADDLNQALEREYERQLEHTSDYEQEHDLEHLNSNELTTARMKTRASTEHRGCTWGQASTPS